jgi:hypothetical protein
MFTSRDFAVYTHFNTFYIALTNKAYDTQRSGPFFLNLSLRDQICLYQSYIQWPRGRPKTRTWMCTPSLPWSRPIFNDDIYIQSIV